MHRLPLEEWAEQVGAGLRDVLADGFGPVYRAQHSATNTQEHHPEKCVDCGAAAAYRGRHRAEG